MFLSFTENLFSAQPIGPSEYLKSLQAEYSKNLQKFSRPFDASDLTSPVFKECGLDPSEVRVIDVYSIIDGAFENDPVSRDYYRRLLKSEDELRDAFRDFVNSDCTAFITGEKDKNEAYKQFVIDTIFSGFGSQKHRERIVSFLAAVEYRKNIDPNFKVVLTRGDKFAATDYGDHLRLALELNDGRHPSDCIKRNFVVPQTGKNLIRSRLDITDSISGSIYTCSHELGHATRFLLGISAYGTSLTQIEKNPFMKNTFFPILEKGETDAAYFSYLTERLVCEGLKSKSYPDALEVFSAMEETAWEMAQFDQEFHDRIESEFLRADRTLGIEQIKHSLEKNKIIDDEYGSLARFIGTTAAFANWINAEDIFQIAGATVADDCIIIDRNSDLDLFSEQGLPARWSHIFANPAESAIIVDVGPEEKYLRALFLLHGLRR